MLCQRVLLRDCWAGKHRLRASKGVSGGSQGPCKYYAARDEVHKRASPEGFVTAFPAGSFPLRCSPIVKSSARRQLRQYPEDTHGIAGSLGGQHIEGQCSRTWKRLTASVQESGRSRGRPVIEVLQAEAQTKLFAGTRRLYLARHRIRSSAHLQIQLFRGKHRLHLKNKAQIRARQNTKFPTLRLVSNSHTQATFALDILYHYTMAKLADFCFTMRANKIDIAHELQYVDALRCGKLQQFKHIESESSDWWFPTLDRGSGACLHFAVDHGQVVWSSWSLWRALLPCCDSNFVQKEVSGGLLVACCILKHIASYLQWMLDWGCKPSIKHMIGMMLHCSLTITLWQVCPEAKVRAEVCHPCKNLRSKLILIADWGCEILDREEGCGSKSAGQSQGMDSSHALCSNGPLYTWAILAGNAFAFVN